jgi:HEPN domain-containing protein
LRPYESWFEKARNDLQTAQELLSDTHPALDTAIQYALESATKSLKAFLKLWGQSFREQSPDEAGDLGELIDLCVETDPGFSSLSDPVEELTAYGIIFRDPEEAEITPEKNEAAEAVRLAENIYEFVAAKIRLNKEPPMDTNIE